MIEVLKTHGARLAEEDRLVAVLIDDAHDLDKRTLREIVCLTELHSGNRRLVQIVLAGRPELKRKVAALHLGSVALQYELDPLKPQEVGRYIEHRLTRAGYAGKPVFTSEAIEAIARDSNGIPGSINILCDNALLAAYVASKRVSAGTVHEVARELQFARESAGSTDSTARSGWNGWNIFRSAAPEPAAGSENNEKKISAGSEPNVTVGDAQKNRSWAKVGLVLLAVAIAGFAAIVYFSQRDLQRSSPARFVGAEDGAPQEDPNRPFPQGAELIAPARERSVSSSVESRGEDPGAGDSASIRVHISQERDRGIVPGITRALRENGYRVSEAGSARSATQGNVRFFFPSDRQEAERIKALVEKELTRRGRRISLGLFEHDGGSSRFAAPGEFEVWLPPILDSQPERQTAMGHPYSPRTAPLERFGAD
jgi:hypothetical protein